MDKVIVCGCGAVGSAFVSSLARRAVAYDRIIALHLVDNGRVEKRNLASQDFSPGDTGRYKAEVLQEKWHSPSHGLTITSTTDTVATPDEIDHRTFDLVIDAFDNAASRLLVATCGGTVIHGGLSPVSDEAAIGFTSRTGYSSWPYHPLNMIEGSENYALPSEFLKPCELIDKAPLIMKVGYVMAKFAGEYLGFNGTPTRMLHHMEIIGDDCKVTESFKEAYSQHHVV